MFDKFSIGAKLQASYGVLSCLLVLSAFSGFSGLKGVAQRNGKLSAVNQMSRNILEIRHLEMQFRMTKDFKYSQVLDERLRRLNTQAKATDALVTDQLSHDQLSVMISAIGIYQTFFQQFVDESTQQSHLQGKMTQASSVLVSLIETFQANQNKHLFKEAGRARKDVLTARILKVSAGAKALQSVELIQITTKDYLLSHDPKYTKKIHQEFIAFQRNLVKLKKTLSSPVQKKAVDAILQAGKQYMNDFKAYTVQKEDQQEAQNALMLSSDKVVELTETSLSYQQQKMDAEVGSSEVSVIVVAVGAILLSIVLGFVFSRNLRRRILNLRGHIQKVERTKNLFADKTIESEDEIGQIGVAINNFILEIRLIIQEFAKGASILATASTELSTSTVEISKTADSLRDNAESSASAAQETSSNLQLMSEAINQINGQISEIQRAGEETNHLAATGTEAVHEARDSMSAITDSSKKIVGITKVIEAIASQTNLLSLNAAIEAAKAGDFGKGFAVVAEEVRGLADRSTTAVAEIKQLIEKSETDVNKGNQVVLRTSDALDQIISAVQTISSGIDQNARNIAEQDSSTREASLAVENIARTAESNAESISRLASTANEVNQTAKDLNQTAGTLNEQISHFSFGEA